MRTSTRLMISAAIIAATSASAFAVPASSLQHHDFDMSARMRAMAPNASAFNNPRNDAANAINHRMESRLNLADSRRLQPSPNHSMGPVGSFYDLDGPNGELWYYTRTLRSKEIEHEYYTEYVLSEYRFDIYDSQLNLVGTVSDKMRYQDDEVRVPGPEQGIDLLPVITQKFFNDDDLYEIVVSIAVNSTTPGINHYRSVIYSIGGAKEEMMVYNPETDAEDIKRVCDKPVNQYGGFVGDVLDASTSGNEIIYMSFLREQYDMLRDLDWDKLMDVDNIDPEEGQKYWNAVSTNKYILEMKGKADANGKLTDVLTWEVPLLCVQGDSESTALMFTTARDGHAYAVCPRYREIYYNPYYSPIEDLTMREGNSFIIDLYEIVDSTPVLVKTTEIPLEKFDDGDSLFTFYGVGRLRYSSDLDFGTFTDDGLPCYYITRSAYAISTDDESNFCYYVYDSDGKKLRTIFENADSHMSLTEVPGRNPMHLFVSYDDVDGYTYNFTDLVDGYHPKRTVAIPYLLEGDDILLANMDVVPLADAEDGFKIAFEMRVPSIDDYDNDLMRIAWFDNEGEFDRMDYVNMGPNVFYAQSYMNGRVLNPQLFNDDDEFEYMVLIKRGIDASGESSASQEELVIGQPESDEQTQGNTLLHLTPCEKGNLRTVGVYPGIETENALFISYLGDKGYTADFYALPFDMSSIEELVSDAPAADGALAFDGETLTCPGEKINVYEVSGKLVATGCCVLSVKDLPSGVYVATAGGHPYKFIK